MLLSLAVATGFHAEVHAASSAAETQVVYLSGRGSDDAVEWDFFCSDGRKSGAWSKIRVPSCWEQEGFGTYNYGIGFYGKANPPGLAREQGKYRHQFHVPAEWQNGRVRIVFEGSMTDTHVRINGISAGPAHQGGFYRFRFDITGWLKFGASNQIEITVDKESANESVNMAERRADYWNFGGIFRPVFLEAVPAHFIERTAIDARADGNFSAEVFLGSGYADATTKVTAQIVDATGAPVGAEIEGMPTPGGDKVVLRTRVTNPKLWTAETPQLYRVRFALHRAGVVQHTLGERFGFRTFEVRAGDGLYLNGQRILLKGVNRHSFWPETGRTLTRERNYADVRLIREMNMNAVRMSHYPPDPEFLEACDELGLYVLNELGGWHGAYDAGVGRKLVAELVQRDVNHPSIVFWDNGNEGGWNVELDGEFAKWDPQNRPVLHPQKKLSGVETMHYRSYGEMQEFFRGPDIFMPTEFLHGLYDGGHGAGLHDYWEMMRKHPRSGGGFLWVFADEGVARTDQGGRVDNVGNYGADGIVGPHHEREGSFDTIREVWSPVAVEWPKDFAGTLKVENRYDFTNLDQCTFAWSLARFPAAAEKKAGHTVSASGELRGPSLAPHAAGELKLPLPANWRDADVLYVTVKNPAGESLWTSSWSWDRSVAISAAPAAPAAPAAAAKVAVRDEPAQLLVSTGALELRFDKATGELASVQQAGKALSFGQGPRFVAVRRGDRTLDGTVDREAAKGVDRVYNDISGQSKLASLTTRADGDALLIEANYLGNLRRALWRVAPDGSVQLDYEYGYDGVVELMGVRFEYPEANVKSMRWLGHGPYRVWQNRVHGSTLDVWEKAYNDPIPGETFIYPEFKGYFRDWRWATFETTEGAITLTNGNTGAYLGVYTPRDGRDALLYTLPATGLAVLDVIPAVRNKVNATDLVGPSSQPQHVSGPRRGTLHFRFDAAKL
ncbi:MAG TPA: glycoside hydrolase family 2 TIM barrel-domain containing protein [Opitutaceae bacterium]|nr:glycoside hydrolase family 2 TIM barrel-domain containing protein [Opitutaceae bacterium]